MTCQPDYHYNQLSFLTHPLSSRGLRTFCEARLLHFCRHAASDSKAGSHVQGIFLRPIVATRGAVN